MVYWSIPAEHREAADMARAHGGFLADGKVTFVKELAGNNFVLPHSSYKTASYIDEKPPIYVV